MDRLEPHEQLEDLRQVSANISDYLERRLYLDQFGEEADVQPIDILQQCYSILLLDLKDLGIDFSLEQEDILGDWFTAKHLYHIAKLVSVEFLAEVLNTEELLNKVESLLNKDEDIEIFESFYSVLQVAYPNTYDIQVLDYIVPFVTTNETFITYLENTLIELRSGDVSLGIPDPTKARLYIDKVQRDRKLVKELVEEVLPYLENIEIDQELLNLRINTYDLDKLRGDNLKIYSAIDLEDQVPEFLQKYKFKMMTLHHQRSPHHVEYWIHNNKQPTNTDVVMLVIHHYDSVAQRNEPEQAVKSMVENNSQLFTEEQVQLINLLVDKLNKHKRIEGGVNVDLLGIPRQ